MTDSGTGETPLRVVAGRYELLEVVGSGGMGVVHRGRDRVLDRTVAVKMIRSELADDDFVRRFEREAAILARLRSPHIVVVYDYGNEGGAFYLVTDFLVDGDLADWLATRGPMAPLPAASLMAQLAEGLADAHAAGVIHRDIKPGNVLLWRRAGVLQPVLGDFGIAVTQDLSLTATGGVIGSPHFMAPERHLGQTATVATDIYAMGCLLFNVLMGRAPYEGTVFQTANAHLNAPVPTLPPGLPAAGELDAILAGCMAKDPESRIGTAAALAEQLRGVVARHAGPTVEVRRDAAATSPAGLVAPASPVPARPAGTDDWPSGTARTEPRRRGRAVAAVLAVAAVVGAIAGSTWLLGRDDDEPTDPGGTPRSDATSPSAPVAPGEVKAEVSRGERMITIDVDLPASEPGVQLVVERQDDAQWVTTGSVVQVPASVGNERVCTTLRLVAVAGDLRTPGSEDDICGRADKPMLSLQRGDPDCTNPNEAEFADRPCIWLNLSITGLRSNDDYTVTIQEDGAPVTQKDAKPFRSDAQGRISHGPGIRNGTEAGGGFYIGASTEVLVMRVSGEPALERRFVVADIR